MNKYRASIASRGKKIHIYPNYTKSRSLSAILDCFAGSCCKFTGRRKCGKLEVALHVYRAYRYCVPAGSPVAAAHRIRVYPRGYWINSGVYRGANAFEAINAGCYRMIAALILDADRIYWASGLLHVGRCFANLIIHHQWRPARS